MNCEIEAALEYGRLRYSDVELTYLSPSLFERDSGGIIIVESFDRTRRLEHRLRHLLQMKRKDVFREIDLAVTRFAKVSGS